MRIIWAPAARSDLQAIRDYVARDNAAAAARLVERLIQAARVIAAHPEAGRLGRFEGTREFLVPRTAYILPYRISTGRVEIIRVLHSARRWPKVL